MENDGKITDWLDPTEVPKELWIIIFNYMKEIKSLYPASTAFEYILPFIRLICRHLRILANEYAEATIGRRAVRQSSVMAVLTDWGAISCIKLLRDYGLPWGEGVCEIAAKKGNLELLKYAHESGCPWNCYSNHKSVCFNAALGGSLACMLYAREQRSPWDESVCAAAAKGGHLDMLKFLHEKGCPWDESTTRSAVNNTECLKYALGSGCHMAHDAARMAAREGNVAGLTLLFTYGCEKGEAICVAAAEGGKLEALKYAHENRCPWGVATSRAAAMNDHFDCVKYLHENGCAWDEYVFKSAVGRGSLELLQYLIDCQCPFDLELITEALMKRSFSEDKAHRNARYLLDRGFNLDVKRIGRLLKEPSRNNK